MEQMRRKQKMKIKDQKKQVREEKRQEKKQMYVDLATD